ncbi:MAG TPA: purine-nucleoside phosphorylase [Chloroflexi bacterium]|nr:purine-nucleoside phosphorylase [Chloroflexota bacterium]
MTGYVTRDTIIETVEYIRSHTRHKPSIGIVLGSGLSPLGERVDDVDVIPYDEIPHFVPSTVPGHSGRLLVGTLGGAQVLLLQGRTHFYEGYSTAQVTLPIRAMQYLGVKTLLVTNAAGGIHPTFAAGDLMVITDHINLVGLAGHNPLRGPNEASFGERFPSMAPAYDPALITLAEEVARGQGVTLRRGVYAMVAGPSYETPAEIRFLRTIGADAVGMSTAPEVVVARHAGMRVLGISVISNVAIASLEDTQEMATHDEVLEAGRRAIPALVALVEGILTRLARS